MKTSKISILDEAIHKINDTFTVEIPDDGTLIDALAGVDTQLKLILKGKPSPLGDILQLIWNPQTGELYSDVGIEARDSKNEWIPVVNDPLLSLPTESNFMINPKAGL
ncbi:MAG: hypothetical protein EU536_01085 [Promethearchaeota archaeon]|nr:MAG: hypothetical protein EU536_01085 [Candidatus Lokiarchaeota archaeon]